MTTQQSQSASSALRRREPRAIEEWFLDHADLVYTFVYFRVGKDAEVAADVVQETFVAALERIDQYDPNRGSMLVWLRYVSRNRIRAANRQRARLAGGDDIWERIDARLESAATAAAEDRLPSDVLERSERAELVQMTLANLPDRYSRALVEHYVEHTPLAEMASRSGTSASAVKSLLFRARAAFRSAFVVISGELDAGFTASRRTS